MEKVWVIETPQERLRKRRRSHEQEWGPSVEKDPAKAYTRSLIFWGWGQLYTDQLVKGTVFMSVMLLCCAGAVLGIAYADSLLPVLRSWGHSSATLLLAAEGLFFCLLIFWTYNAGDAYHAAVKTRKRPFPGVQSRVAPLLCSLLVPGWGQFLNGQAVKGSIFTGLSVLGFFALGSIPAVLLAWTSLEVSDARMIIEGIFAITVLSVPLIPVIWLFSSFDAWKVSSDDLKKEPLWERIKAANNRRRTQGWVRGVFPDIKSTAVLGFVLTACVLIITLFSFPAGYYVGWLTDIQTQLQKEGMTLVPELIRKVLSFITRAGN